MRRHSFIHSVKFVALFVGVCVRSFLCSFLCSLLCSFLCSFLRSVVPLFLRSVVRTFVPSFGPSFLRSFVRLLFLTCEFLSSPGLDRRTCLLAVRACVIVVWHLLAGGRSVACRRCSSLTHSLTHALTHETSTLSPTTRLSSIHVRCTLFAYGEFVPLGHRALFQTYPLRFLFCVFAPSGWVCSLCLFCCGVCFVRVRFVVSSCAACFFSPPVLCRSCCGVFPFFSVSCVASFFFLCGCRAVVA